MKKSKREILDKLDSVEKELRNLKDEIRTKGRDVIPVPYPVPYPEPVRPRPWIRPYPYIDTGITRIRPTSEYWTHKSDGNDYQSFDNLTGAPVVTYTGAV